MLATSKARISIVLVSLAAIQDLMRETAVWGVLKVPGDFPGSALKVLLENMSVCDACKIKEKTSDSEETFLIG